MNDFKSSLKCAGLHRSATQGGRRLITPLAVLWLLASVQIGVAQNQPATRPAAKPVAAAGAKTNLTVSLPPGRASNSRPQQPPQAVATRQQSKVSKAFVPAAPQALESVEGQSFRGYTIPRVNAAPVRIGGRTTGGITAVTIRVRMSDGQRVVRDTVASGGVRLP